MLRYPTPSDQRFADATNPAVPQGSSTYWPPHAPDGTQSAVTREPDDRHGPPRLRAGQLSSSAYASAAVFSQRDTYPAQSQADCSVQYPYPSQQYIQTVNYVSPPFDFAEYPIVPGSAYHTAPYPTQSSTRYEYPPSVPAPFHQPITYDPTGYFSSDSPYSSLHGQHQQNLVSHPTGYLRCGDSFDHYDAINQHPVLSIPPSSSSSELGNALVEVPSPETQSMSRASIALPALPKHDPSEGALGLNPVKSEYGATSSGQSFSSMPSLNSPRKDPGQQVHVGSSAMARPSTPMHGHGSLRHRQHPLDSFRLVQDAAAYPGFAPPAKRHPPPPSLSIPGPLSYSPGGRISTPLSSSFSPSDTGTPTSSVNLLENGSSASSLSPPTLVPNPKAGQGVLKLPSTKRSARRKPAIACLFCRERKIACGPPPVGSADTTCNQCARRSRKCEYPTMSRRGLHKRRDNGGSHHRESEDADYVPTT
ncbi:hypothetical protein F5148DRAFT_1344699 [Russula earlei]|uniref:Uncharacterized protein n=1 Tax=Russula earlei TaxID=71964 RepID=A0ACC0TU39_9AGAM|nr:hypothetical protein F5148DRAFT_1344699 [Russula earlei]